MGPPHRLRLDPWGVPPLDAPTKGAHLERGPRARLHVEHAEGLGRKVVRTELHSARARLGVLDCTDDDHRDVRRAGVCAQVLEHAKAIEPGDHQVEQDDVRASALGRGERLDPVHRDVRLPTRCARDLPEQLDVERVVVDDERPNRRVAHSTSDMFSKRVKSLKKRSFVVPMGPLRCLAMMISATFFSSVSLL